MIVPMMPALALLLGLFAAPAAAVTAEPALAGTTWKVLLDRGRLPQGLWGSDLLLFGKSSVVAIECLSWGYAPAGYVETREGDRTHWSASFTTVDGRVVRWRGTRTGRRMEGTLVLSAPDEPPVELAWRAVPRPRPASLPPGF